MYISRENAHTAPRMAGLGRSYSHQDLSQKKHPPYEQTEGNQHSYSSYTSQRPMSSSIRRPTNESESKLRPQSSSSRRLSFSLHDISKPWAADNTNLINGFYAVTLIIIQIFIQMIFSGTSTWPRRPQVSAHNVRI